MERPSRRNASKAAKAEAATAGLKHLKEKGLKRFDTVEDAEDNNVYDVVRARAVSLSLPHPAPLTKRASVHTTASSLPLHPTHLSPHVGGRPAEPRPVFLPSFLPS